MVKKLLRKLHLLQSSEKRLKSSGLTFQKTRLGQAVFIPPQDLELGWAVNGLFPDRWSVEQLMAMADYMREHQDCTIFSDGSGKKIKLK